MSEKKGLPWRAPAPERVKREMDRQANERKLSKKLDVQQRAEAVEAYDEMRANLPKKPPALPRAAGEAPKNSARRALVRDLMDGTVGDTAYVGKDGMRRVDASPFGVRRVWKPRRAR